MKKNINLYTILISIFASIFFSSCVSIPSSATSSGPRTLLLNGLTISEAETDNGFTSWYCTDYVYDDFDSKVLFEVGYFSKNSSTYGFILYDGGYTGELTLYSRDGLNYRWDWHGICNYSIIIEPDNTALYYDFKGVPAGEGTKAKGIYKAHKR